MINHCFRHLDRQRVQGLRPPQERLPGRERRQRLRGGRQDPRVGRERQGALPEGHPPREGAVGQHTGRVQQEVGRAHRPRGTRQIQAGRPEEEVAVCGERDQ